MKVRPALFYALAAPSLALAQAGVAAPAQYLDANGKVIDAATFRKLAPGHGFIFSKAADGKTSTIKIMNSAEAAANDKIEHDPRLPTPPPPTRAAPAANGKAQPTGKPRD